MALHLQLPYNQVAFAYEDVAYEGALAGRAMLKEGIILGATGVLLSWWGSKGNAHL